jgi:hypothetical protein
MQYKYEYEQNHCDIEYTSQHIEAKKTQAYIMLCATKQIFSTQNNSKLPYLP